MNDFVLCGFCKKCADEVVYDIEAMRWFHNSREQEEICGNADGIGFLSAKQMKIVFESDEFEEWASQENYFELCNNAFTLIVKVLDENPFLVSRILKDAGEKSKEENK